MKIKVLVRHSFEIIEEWESEYATKGHIEFYYNEGTSCADNILRDIQDYIRNHPTLTCACPLQDSEVIRIIEDAESK